MKDWIPLLQTLVWPVFIILFFYLARSQITDILRSIAARIERGDSFQAGPSGISISSAEPKLTRLEEFKDADAVEKEAALSTGSSNSQTKPPPMSPIQYENVIYLIHSVSAPRIDTDGIERRPVKVIVEADSEDILDQIERVVYHLHPTFVDPDRETHNRKRRFEIKILPWGEFNIAADIYIRGYELPLKLSRYLNFWRY